MASTRSGRLITLNSQTWVVMLVVLLALLLLGAYGW
jgi:hypothetical protein